MRAAILLAMCVASPALAAGGPRAAVDYGRFPLAFEENQGQLDPQVRFAARGRDLAALLTDQGPVLVSGGGEVRMALQGASGPGAAPVAERALPGKVNVFIGNDPSKWKAGIRTFEDVRYRGVYPGVDLVVHGRQGRFEYDFELQPGANAEQIRVRFEGAKAKLNARGELELVLPGGGTLVQRAPVAYRSGDKKKVAARNRVFADGSVGFWVDKRERGAGVVIDPVLVYSTYLGGTANEFPVGMAVDVLGNAYITGNTLSADFPVASALQRNNTGGQDVYVAKVDDTGRALVYSTYVGGSADETGRDLAADASGAVYVVGFTTSDDFPTANAFQRQKRGSQDGFIFKLSPSGNAMVYGTYFGGSADTLVNGIALDAYGDAYLTGNTGSDDFPIANAFQTTIAGGHDSFVAELSANGQTLLYSSYLGGSGDDFAREIAVDPTGAAYIVGYTNSFDFPHLNAVQPTLRGPAGSDTDAFLTKVNPAGTAIVFSTYLGGTRYDEADDVTVDPIGVVTVAGYTASLDFPLVNEQQSTYGGGSSDGFVTRYTAAGDAITYSSYIGGMGQDGVRGVAVEASGGVFLGGYTASTDFPNDGTVPPSANSGGFDAFVTHFTAGGNRDFSTYLGGAGDDYGRGLAVDGSGNAYTTGQTNSTNFPVVAGAIQGTRSGGNDAFLAKVGTTVAQVTAVNPSSGPTAGGTVISISGVNFNAGSTVTVGGNGCINVTVISTTTITCATPAHAAGVVDVTVNRRVSGSATATGAFTYTSSPPPPPPSPTITRIAPPSGTAAGGTTFTITGTNFQPGATISFGGAAATGISFVSPTTLTGDTPAHAAGAVDVVVTNPDGQPPAATLAGGFTFVAGPAVTDITPRASPVTGQTTVAITGTGFSTGVTISIGGNPLLSPSVASSTRVTGIAPPHPAGVVDVVAINPDGQRGALVGAFVYAPPPSVSSITPASGPAAGETRVTIMGASFVSGATVTIDGVAATSVGVISATQIDATMPPHAPGMVDVVVSNPDGQTGQLPRAFTYEAPPQGYAGWSCGCSSGSGAFALLGALAVMALRRRRRAASAVALAVLSVMVAPVAARAAPATAGEAVRTIVVAAGPTTTKPSTGSSAPAALTPPATTTGTKPAATTGTATAPGTATTTGTSTPAPGAAGSSAAPVAGATKPAPTSPAASAAPSSSSVSPSPLVAPASKKEDVDPFREEPTTSLVKVTATGFGDFVGRRIGAELGGSAGVVPWVDLGLAATLGPKVGGRLTVSLHTPRPVSGLSPFLQLRGILNPVPEGLGVGGGAWLGGALEAGPGRLMLGVAGEYVAGPPQYLPVGVWVLGGYEFDLLRPERPGGFALLRGRVMDLEEKPLSAVVTFPGSPPPLAGKKYDASPTFEARLTPGEHAVEVRAPGYLVRGKSLVAHPNETLVVDFTLRPEPQERKAELTETSIEIRQMIQFEFNKARLLKESYEILDEVTDILLQHKELKIRIEGHTDDVGGAEFNRKLSQARAEAVRNYLVDWGVEPERLVAEGYGMTRPITTNATEAGRAANRRVQFKIIGK